MQDNDKTNAEKALHASIVLFLLAFSLLGWLLFGWLVS
jgi:hypothetical protein